MIPRMSSPDTARSMSGAARIAAVAVSYCAAEAVSDALAERLESEPGGSPSHRRGRGRRR
jgi:hypothetical protein